MGTRKKNIEMIFNLQWRNKPDNGGDRSNVIGMYDTPTTTSNFEMFKSYLLKNSGVAGNDVKVTYITDNGQEWLIDSQEWFEIALSSFRLKAKLKEVILLKLEKIGGNKLRKPSNDVETQSDVDSMGPQDIAPPAWFLAYMDQFKKEIVEEITENVASISSKETVIVSKKVKPEPSKRSRRHLLGESSIDKELLKTLKYDRKLENKLDKLDAKTKKIKEKKQALMVKLENDEHRYNLFSSVSNPDEETPLIPAAEKKEEVKSEDQKNDCSLILNAANAKPGLKEYYCMLGGEIYWHTWEIVNNGKIAWSPNTELRFTWGSADLVPHLKNIKCPMLKPGEKDKISVRFFIPTKPGRYETYWNFYDDNVRFGSSLNCCVLVEEPLALRKKEPVELPQDPVFDISPPKSLAPVEPWLIHLPDAEIVLDSFTKIEGKTKKMDRNSDTDVDCDWESMCSCELKETSNKYGILDNELIVELPEKETEGIVKNEDNNNNCEVASVASDVSSGYDVVQAPVCEEKETGLGYVYITIDGNKIPVPRHILRPDFLETAEVAPAPVSEDEQQQQPAQENVSVTTHCSATGSSFSETPSRLFIFPQRQPGFEVVSSSMTTSEPSHIYTWAKSDTQYSYSNPLLQQTVTEHSCQMRPTVAQPPKESPGPAPVHILPENLVSGAVNVASSAINTARSVINMIVPPKSEPGRWENGHWVTEKQDSLRAKNLCILAEMGFWNTDLNATLLARYNDDIDRVLNDLIQ